MLVAVLIFFFSFFCFFLVNLYRRFSPGVLLCSTWLLIYLLQYVFAPDMYVSLSAVVIVFLLNLFFAMGDLLGAGFRSTYMNLRNGSEFEEQPYGIFFERNLGLVGKFLGFLSVLGAIEYARVLGLFGYNSIEEAILHIGATRGAMMSGDIQVPYVSRVGFLLAYSCLVIGLTYYFFYGWRWWISLPLLSIFIMAVSQSGRAGLMIALLQLMIAGFLRSTFVLKRRLIKTFTGFFLPLLLLMLVFFGGQFLREGFANVSGDDAVRVAVTLRGYLFGGISAFSYYVDYMMDDTPVSFGVYSFSGLVAAIGIHPQAAGVYDEYVPIDTIGSVTNIFSAHRSFIDDFSIPGSCLFFLAFGFLSGFVHETFVSGKMHAVSILIPIMSWILFSPMYSLTYFNSFLISCFFPLFVSEFILFISRVKNKRLKAAEVCCAE